jgi:hydroxyacylglutathione hydrolase
LSNLRFATAVEPGNAAVEEHTRACRRLREADEPTLPSTIDRERAINPFLRCGEPAVIESARAHGATDIDEISVLAALRGWKNRF